MAVVAIVLWLMYVLLATVRPLVVRLRRTGDSGFRRGAGTARAVAGALFPVSYLLVSLGPVLDLSRGLDRLAALVSLTAQATGITLAVAGVALIVVAQQAMGPSWRMGVDASEQTELVTGGPFRSIRNPIYTGMVGVALGIALIVPNPVSIAGLAFFIIAVEVQTRAVEEPYLLTSHGNPYRRYAATSGRFLPGVGRL